MKYTEPPMHLLSYINGDIKRKLYQHALRAGAAENKQFGRIYVNNRNRIQTNRAVTRLIRRGYFKMSIRPEGTFLEFNNKLSTKRSGRTNSYMELTAKGRADAKRMLKL